MNPEESQLLQLHAVGFGLFLLQIAMNMAPLKIVLRARAVGSLGGLDTSQWPFFFASAFFWSLYCFRLGDFWLFLCFGPWTPMWLFFNITAIKLLAQETGELENVWKDYGRVTRSAGSIFNKTMDFGEGQLQDHQAIHIRVHERLLLASMAIGISAGFLCCQWNTPGLEFLDDYFTAEAKLNTLGSLAVISSLVKFAQPVSRIWAMWKSRDGSSVFAPMVLTVMLCQAFNAMYAMLRGNLFLIPASVASLLICCVQLLMWLCFPEKDRKTETDSIQIKVAPRSSRTSLHSRGTRLSQVSQQLSHQDTSPDRNLQNKGTQSYDDYLAWQRSYNRYKLRKGTKTLMGSAMASASSKQEGPSISAKSGDGSSDVAETVKKKAENCAPVASEAEVEVEELLEWAENVVLKRLSQTGSEVDQALAEFSDLVPGTPAK